MDQAKTTTFLRKCKDSECQIIVSALGIALEDIFSDSYDRYYAIKMIDLLYDLSSLDSFIDTIAKTGIEIYFDLVNSALNHYTNMCSNDKINMVNKIKIKVMQKYVIYTTLVQ
jgi:hypothetical protein